MAVFCSDIDGTLLNADRTLSDRTVEAIREIRGAGHTFVLCSSRMPSSMKILEALYNASDAPLIAYNGGLVLSSAGRVVASIPIPAAIALDIYKLCERLGVHGSFYAGDEWHIWAEDRWAEREINNTAVQPSTVRAAEYARNGSISVSPPHKIMCMGEAHLIDEIEAALSTRTDVVTYRSKPTYLEIANASCDKGTGLRAVEDDLGADVGDCYFFGDNFNDLPAFSVVGTSIAVANAKDEVLSAASVVTGRHHDDGVAQYLESWLTEHPKD